MLFAGLRPSIAAAITVKGCRVIDILTNAESVSRADDFQEMFRLRHRVFKERLDWQVKTRNGLEVDPFDELDPAYLMAFDGSSRLVGTWRMLPTTGPYMLRDVFPFLLEGMEAPHHPKIWEGSRFAVDCDYVGRSGLAALSLVTSEIFCAVVEFCIVNGYTEVVTVYDARIGRLLPRLGCVPKWRSRQVRIGNTLTMAGRFDANPAVLNRIRETNGIRGSVIRQAPWKLADAAA
jgi:acyl homoserine lactone synthase